CLTSTLYSSTECGFYFLPEVSECLKSSHFLEPQASISLKAECLHRTSLRIFKSVSFLTVHPREVHQHCRRTTLTTTFRPLIFSRTLQNLAPATGGTRVFRKKSRIQSARSRFTRHMDPKNGEKQGVKGQKQKET